MELRKCPKCGRDGGLILCPVCHTRKQLEIFADAASLPSQKIKPKKKGKKKK